MQHKKQLQMLVEAICKLNERQWSNPRGQFDPLNGSAMIIEEALELIGAPNPRETSRQLVESYDELTDISRVDQFDALLDTLYITIGELHKLGATPEDITDGLQIVHNANVAKSGSKDANGKVTKPEGFVGPEEALSKLVKRFPLIA